MWGLIAEEDSGPKMLSCRKRIQIATALKWERSLQSKATKILGVSSNCLPFLRPYQDMLPVSNQEPLTHAWTCFVLQNQELYKMESWQGFLSPAGHLGISYYITSTSSRALQESHWGQVQIIRLTALCEQHEWADTNHCETHGSPNAKQDC